MLHTIDIDTVPDVLISIMLTNNTNVFISGKHLNKIIHTTNTAKRAGLVKRKQVMFS